MVDYLEIEDYDQESFFELEDNWDEYKSIIEEWTEPTPQEKDLSYNIFTLEQAASTINELSKKYLELALIGNSTYNEINDFIKQYTELSNKIGV